MKRIIALVGVAFLILMYAATMFFAVSDSPSSAGWFKASIACTIIVPVLLYAYSLVYKHLKDHDDHQKL